MKLDAPVHNLVAALDDLEGITTLSNCCEDAEFAHELDGKFYVNFAIEESPDGLESLAKIAKSLFLYDVDLQVYYSGEPEEKFAPGKLAFSLTGAGDPDHLAMEIERERIGVFILSRAHQKKEPA